MAQNMSAFTIKCLSGAEWHYSNIEWKALTVLHGLKKFHHYCFARELYIITDHKPLVAMVNEDSAELSHWLQHIILHIHQYNMCILYKPGYELIMDWLSHNNHTENRNQEISAINISMCTITSQYAHS